MPNHTDTGSAPQIPPKSPSTATGSPSPGTSTSNKVAYPSSPLGILTGGAALQPPTPSASGLLGDSASHSSYLTPSPSTPTRGRAVTIPGTPGTPNRICSLKGLSVLPGGRELVLDWGTSYGNVITVRVTSTDNLLTTPKLPLSPDAASTTFNVLPTQNQVAVRMEREDGSTYAQRIMPLSASPSEKNPTDTATSFPPRAYILDLARLRTYTGDEDHSLTVDQKKTLNNLLKEFNNLTQHPYDTLPFIPATLTLIKQYKTHSDKMKEEAHHFYVSRNLKETCLTTLYLTSCTALGLVAGGIAGAAIGSIIPGVGTVVGGFIGALAGALIGTFISLLKLALPTPPTSKETKIFIKTHKEYVNNIKLGTSILAGKMHAFADSLMTVTPKLAPPPAERPSAVIA